MNKQTLALKPCPFCGGEAEFMPKVPPTIRCTQCSTEMIVGVSSLHHFTANVWNSRPLEDSAKQEQKEKDAKICYEADKSTHPTDLGDIIMASDQQGQ